MSTLQASCNHFDEVVAFMSMIRYVSRYSDHLDVRRFVPGMRIHDISSMTGAGSAQQLIAAYGWAFRWLYRAVKVAAWCRTRRDQTDYFFVIMEKEVNYEYLLCAMVGKLIRLLSDGNLC